jgi:hypothetical protein
MVRVTVPAPVPELSWKSISTQGVREEVGAVPLKQVDSCKSKAAWL